MSWPSSSTTSAPMLTGGEQRLNATPSALSIKPSTLVTPVTLRLSSTPMMICPPSPLAKHTRSFASSAVLPASRLKSVCGFSQRRIRSLSSSGVIEATVLLRASAERLGPAFEHRADLPADLGIIDGRPGPYLASAALVGKAEHQLGVTVDGNVRVVGCDDDLSPTRRIRDSLLSPQQRHDILVDEAVVKVVLGLIQHERPPALGEEQEQQGRRLLAAGEFRKVARGAVKDERYGYPVIGCEYLNLAHPLRVVGQPADEAAGHGLGDPEASDDSSFALSHGAREFHSIDTVRFCDAFHGIRRESRASQRRREAVAELLGVAEVRHLHAQPPTERVVHGSGGPLPQCEAVVAFVLQTAQECVTALLQPRPLIIVADHAVDDRLQRGSLADRLDIAPGIELARSQLLLDASQVFLDPGR